jgi:hypothetical protein
MMSNDDKPKTATILGVEVEVPDDPRFFYYEPGGCGCWTFNANNDIQCAHPGPVISGNSGSLRAVRAACEAAITHYDANMRYGCCCDDDDENYDRMIEEQDKKDKWHEVLNKLISTEEKEQ